ncbi:hypothetical protein [Rhizobium mayense]|uniref:Uncharacterized protein n=1 Tax=Rhizobium mayense TaxID=1312184 RepID=A0ABT7JT12_9HYPH|nr:hypothetical protein [Rhizobium mayense]MDL2399494.1 hypothetical protein [Rhizobium mayense]
MKKIILLAAIGLFSTNAVAMSRHDSQSLTCSAVHDEMAKDGMVVLRHPSHAHPDMMMYDRYVTNSTACIGQGAMGTVSVPTKDDPNCKVKTCVFATGKGPNKNH